MTHGGKREGAGRKPRNDGTVKVPYNTKLTPLVVDFLRQSENAAATIEDTIRRSKPFKNWVQSKQ
jgi:hypothetical protein